MANILLNKPATANNSFAPFLPARAVDGITTDPKSRWVCSQLPAWLCIDLQDSFWINQWTANFMSSVGFATNYYLCDFKLQGSLDNSNWFDMDVITGNTASQVSRTITPRLVKYLRVYITKGLAINNKVASIVDFQATEAPNPPFLSSLVPSLGPLVPAFSSKITNYSINVPSTLSTITFTPTALQPNMKIRLSSALINAAVVTGGQASQGIALNTGSNPVTIEVSSADETMKTNYTVNVIKPATPAYLSSLTIKTNRNALVNIPPLVEGTLNYSASVGSGVASVTIKPSAANSTILVKGIAVPSGADSGAIALASGTNTITINVTSTSGGSSTYTITITKA